MIKAPNMLIIGAAGRNVGKTEFACELIRHYAGKCPVIGIKITTVKERNGKCPRGGQGCGVCSSLQGDFCITEETQANHDKDTARMLRAGADKVFWLRVMAEHLEKGVAKLLESMPAHAAIVCESNSARNVLEPGLFLVVKEHASGTVKQSCADVLPYADRVFFFNGDNWDFQPSQIGFADGEWAIKAEASAIVLGGGKSRRMGHDKSMMPIAGRPMIQHIAMQLLEIFPEVIISANDLEKYAFTGLPVIPDEIEDRGPLMGITSSLAASKNDLNFVTGCDIPHIDNAFIRNLLAQAEGYDIVIPCNKHGHYEPLLAVYRKSVMDPARKIMDKGGRRIVELFDHVRVRTVPMLEEAWYHNLNTPEDLHRFNSQTIG